MVKRERKVFLVLGTAAMLLYALIGWFVFRALSAVFPHISPVWVFIVYGMLTLLPLAAYIIPPSRPAKALGLVANYGICIQCLLLCVALPGDLLDLLLVAILRVVPAHTIAVCMFVGLVLVLMLSVYGLLHAPKMGLRKLSHTSVRANGRGALRIVQISDTHLGFVNDLTVVRDIVRQVNALAPDLVCFTGDMFNENTGEVYNIPAFAEAFRGIHSTYGVYGCLGNHDSGRDFPKMMAFFEDAGIHILQDEWATINGKVQVVGRVDLSLAERGKKGRLTIEKLLAETDDTLPVILMDHQPAAVEEAAAAGVDLLLCGHTHGGQFIPVNLVIRHVFPFYRGAKRIEQMLAVISSGTFTGMPPMRIGSRGEIVVVELSC